VWKYESLATGGLPRDVVVLSGSDFKAFNLAAAKSILASVVTNIKEQGSVLPNAIRLIDPGGEEIRRAPIAGSHPSARRPVHEIRTGHHPWPPIPQVTFSRYSFIRFFRSHLRICWIVPRALSLSLAQRPAICVRDPLRLANLSGARHQSLRWRRQHSDVKRMRASHALTHRRREFALRPHALV
jgi:hypothetical protein